MGAEREAETGRLRLAGPGQEQAKFPKSQTDDRQSKAHAGAESGAGWLRSPWSSTCSLFVTLGK